MAHCCAMPKAQITPNQAADSLLDDKMLADYVHTKPRTIRRWRNEEHLPFIRITSRVIRYRRADVDAWLARR
jgi:excisionase family DNA binding protein